MGRLFSPHGGFGAMTVGVETLDHPFTAEMVEEKVASNSGQLGIFKKDSLLVLWVKGPELRLAMSASPFQPCPDYWKSWSSSVWQNP